MHLAKDRKHVFINWDLIDPGYGVSWGADAPTSWETPPGRTPTPAGAGGAMNTSG